ncbi:MAG: ABC transporter permease [Candidatus Riflebacteria bacterium]
MGFVSLAFKNLLFRPSRTALTVAGVGLAVAVAVSLMGFNIGYRKSISASIDKLGFQIMIMAKGCPYEAATMMLKGGSGLLYMPSEIVDQIKQDAKIESITPVFIGLAKKEAVSIRDEGDSAYLIVSGIDKSSFQTMKPWLSFSQQSGYAGGRWFDEEAVDEIVMGYEVAEFEQRKVGDQLLMNITPNGSVESVMHQFKVVGVLERTGTQDDGTVFLPLGAARKIFNRQNDLTIIGIKLKEFSGYSFHEFEQRWNKLPEVQVVGLQQVKTTMISLVETAQTMIAAVAVIAIIVAVIGVINSILMSVFERTGEIGIMKAIGASRSDIFQLIWLETFMLCFSGGLSGAIVAVVGSSAVEFALRQLIDIGVRGSIVQITPLIIVVSIVASSVVGMFAGLYPAWRASSMHPIAAIREGE